jgi:hypothetical protein
MGSKEKVYVNNGQITRIADPLNNKLALEMKTILIATLAAISLTGCHSTLQKQRTVLPVPQPNYVRWGSITNGTPCNRVIQLLGEPERVDDAGIFKFWHYGIVVPQSDHMPEELSFWFSNNGGSAWHKVDPFYGQFSTNGLPITPVLMFPYDGMTLSHDPPYVDFRWRPSSGVYPMSYEIELNPGVNGMTALPHYAQEMVFRLRPVETILWRVRAINVLGKSAWSETRTLKFVNPDWEANKTNGR